MTSSYQSTAFQSSARPVDTFVAEPSVLPKTGMMELAETLQAINPALQKFIGQKIQDRVDDEKIKFQNIAIQEDLLSGMFGNIVTETRKQEGKDAADQLIGASRHGKKAYAKQKTINSTFKINNLIQQRYATDKIDITNDDGSISNVPLTQVSPDRPEFNTWFQGVISPVVNNISKDTDPEILNKFFLPQLQKSITDLDTTARKQFNLFNKNKLLAESTDTIKESAKFFIKAQTYKFRNPEAKQVMENDIKGSLSNLIVDMKNAGITGNDLTSLNESIISNIVNIGDLAITQGNYSYARSLVNFLGESIPGSSPGKTLKDNPKWLEKTTDLFTDIYEKEVEITQRPYKIRQAKLRNDFTTAIEDYRNETNPTIKAQKYQNLQTKFPQKEFQTEIDEFGVLDNQTFIEKANKLRKDITRGIYMVDGEPDKGSAYLELDKLEQLDLTPDSESENIIEEIEREIKEMKSYASNLEKYETKIINDAKSALSTKGGPFSVRGLTNKNAKLLQRYERILTDEADQRMLDFKEDNGRPMNSREIKEMYRDLDDLLKLEVGTFSQEEVDTPTIPEINALGKEGGVILNPFSIADRKKNPLKTPNNSQGQPNNQNEILNDPKMFDTPKLINENQPLGGAASEITQADIDREKALDAEEANAYIVQAGDTLTSIAESFGTTINDIMEVNNITNEDLINIGQQLNMPQESIEEPQINFSDDTRVQSIVTSANELGISPVALAAVIAQESSFRPSVVSVDKATGKKYTGLIQFGPYEIAKYNIKENMTFEEQMVAVTSFLKDRGVRPGDGAKEIYAAIFTGNVSNLDKGGADWEDSNGTTVNKALPGLIEGGSKYQMGIDFLQQTGIYQQKS